MDRKKIRYELGLEELTRMENEFPTRLTLACRKPLKRSDLRRFMASTLAGLGLCDGTVIYYSCDNHNAAQVSWHICFNKRLTAEQLIRFAEKIEELRKKLSLGDKKFFCKFEIEHGIKYMVAHEYFDIQTMN